MNSAPISVFEPPPDHPIVLHFASRLGPAERAQWVGTPDRWAYVGTRMNAYFWQGAIVSTMTILNGLSVAVLGSVTAVAALLAGLAMWEAQRLFYIVTNERILAAYPQFRPWLAAGNPGREILLDMPPDRIDFLRLELSKTGETADLFVNARPFVEMTGLFGKRVGMTDVTRGPIVRQLKRGWSPPTFPAPSFYNGLIGIRDPERVADCIERIVSVEAA